MGDMKDWILRPVLQGLVRYESIISCQITLADLALLNDAMDVEAENRYRVQEAMKERDK